ncbi:MAG: hypothetical protein R3D33_17570 [Hyphomicrobiaceae bacterium]
MKFGKRAASSAAQYYLSEPADETVTGRARPDRRVADLGEELDRFFRSLVRFSLAIRLSKSLERDASAAGLDPESYPIDIGGFDKLFCYWEGGQPRYAFYLYLYPGRETGDPNCQVHLYETMKLLAGLNRMVIEAVRAGQSGALKNDPIFQRRLDRALVLTAYYATFFENMKATEGLFRPGSEGERPVEFRALKASFQRRFLEAEQAMFEPADIERHVLQRRWPYLGIEATYLDHPGQAFIHKVYFPQSFAGVVRSHATRTAAQAVSGTAIAGR